MYHVPFMTIYINMALGCNSFRILAVREQSEIMSVNHLKIAHPFSSLQNLQACVVLILCSILICNQVSSLGYWYPFDKFYGSMALLKMTDMLMA